MTFKTHLPAKLICMNDSNKKIKLCLLRSMNWLYNLNTALLKQKYVDINLNLTKFKTKNTPHIIYKTSPFLFSCCIAPLRFGELKKTRAFTILYSNSYTNRLYISTDCCRCQITLNEMNELHNGRTDKP